jgi:hypothetical protein
VTLLRSALCAPIGSWSTLKCIGNPDTVLMTHQYLLIKISECTACLSTRPCHRACAMLASQQGVTRSEHWPQASWQCGRGWGVMRGCRVVNCRPTKLDRHTDL